MKAKLFTKLTFSILTISFSLFLTVISAHAATLTVTKTADTNDGVCNADCSLREAIAVAGSNDTIVFSSLFDATQTITLSEAVGFQQLTINKNLTITGKGANLLTVRRDPSATNFFRIFHISYANVTLSGMTISGGKTALSNPGGGIYNQGDATLTINACLITGNSVIRGNTGTGGGIANNLGRLYINNSTISNNVVQTDFSNAAGGGIYASGFETVITNSTVSGNTVSNYQGTTGDRNGGGIFNTTSLTIRNTTVTDNDAVGANSAGGIYNTLGVNIGSTIVAANRNNTMRADVVTENETNATIIFYSQGFNLIGNVGSAGSFNQPSDQTGNSSSPINPLLKPLADNGGTTPTHALSAGSTALDKGFSFGNLQDQRGMPRPIDNPAILPAPGGDGSDVGAYEAGLFPPVVVTKIEDTNDGVCDTDCSLREAIAASASGNQITFASPLFDSPQTITLSEATGFQGLSISKNLTITGKGANLLTVRRDPAVSAFFSILNVSNGINLVLSGVTVSGGKVGLSNHSGGIYAGLDSILTVNACHITGNSVIRASDKSGGGISSRGRLYINDSTISNNVVTTDQPKLAGGGIYFGGTEAIITNSTISGNTVLNFSGNTSDSNGGGIFNDGVLTITSSTVTDNGAEGANSASGIYNVLQITIGNTIVAGNRNNSTQPDVVRYTSQNNNAVYLSQGFNLIGNIGGATSFNQATDQKGNASTPINPRLNVLANYGGTTPTHLLTGNSPALDKGNRFGLTFDQRGNSRPVDLSVANATGGDGSDIGAYEAQTLPANQAPTANPESYTTNEDTTLIVNAPGVLSNDYDPEGGSFTAVLVGHTSHGAVFLNANGSFIYNAINNYYGTDSFTYKVNDGSLDSNIVTVFITINPVNDIPVAVNDSYDLRPNTTLTVPALGVLQNDTEVESPLSAIQVSNPSHGTLTLNSNGGFTYTPAQNFSGSDSFTYKANDGTADSNVATVFILVNTPTQWTVTSTADTTVGACDANCTLREAIAAAAPGDEIVFASPLFDTQQTITLTNATGFNTLVIGKSLKITGKGANLLNVRRGTSDNSINGAFRIFNVTGSGVQVTLSGMTISGGHAYLYDGAGINNNSGSTLTVIGCNITGNNAFGFGGGIENTADSTLTVINSTISNNTAGSHTFGTTSANGRGGAGIDNRGTLTVINSTISGNFKNNSNQFSNFNGGGIYTSGTMLITSSTVANNRAEGGSSASGIYNDNGTVTIRNTIVAAAVTPAADVAGSAFTSQGYNLIGNTGSAFGFGATGDQVGSSSFVENKANSFEALAIINPRLDTLGMYGGTVPTHRLQTDSPAIDKGNSFGATTDQRGSLRPSDMQSVPNLADGADIGAYEFQATPTAATVSVGGRVLTTDGRGLSNARIVLTDLEGNERTTISGSLGYFSFSDVEVGQTYIIAVISKRYVFQPQSLMILEEIANLDFAAQSVR